MGAVGVQELQGQRGRDAAEEGTEERLGGEEVGYFLQPEQDSAQRRTKGNRNAGGRGSGEDFTTLAVVAVVFGEETAGNIADAGGDVHIRTLLAQTQARSHAEHQAGGLYDERVQAEETMNDEAAEYDSNLSDSTAGSRVVDHGRRGWLCGSPPGAHTRLLLTVNLRRVRRGLGCEVLIKRRESIRRRHHRLRRESK